MKNTAAFAFLRCTKAFVLALAMMLVSASSVISKTFVIELTEINSATLTATINSDPPIGAPADLEVVIPDPSKKDSWDVNLVPSKAQDVASVTIAKLKDSLNLTEPDASDGFNRITIFNNQLFVESDQKSTSVTPQSAMDGNGNYLSFLIGTLASSGGNAVDPNAEPILITLRFKDLATGPNDIPPIPTPDAGSAAFLLAIAISSYCPPRSGSVPNTDSGNSGKS